MLVSCATGVVAQQALTGIKLAAEFAQARQRQTWILAHRHRRRRFLHHPGRQLRQRAVRLADGQSNFVTMAVAPHDKDAFTATGMKRVADSRLARPIVGIMKLFRPRRGSS
jgi:hypothetical protein